MEKKLAQIKMIFCFSQILQIASPVRYRSGEQIFFRIYL
ncbi:hypothetical protein RC62_1862 [Flavobacterium aquidurense]|uniref:Uncharacterized protein n=1 Tax=Flavobacterium aquidurense TaxID=362413 RepID=A0A0Q0W2D8_9FLAO|nr:hypothetical protein RC62_1862 [Flavobacterium aquidurense]